MLLASLQFDMGDPFHCQLTAVTTQGIRCPISHDSIADSSEELTEVTCYLKLTADQVMDFH